MKSCARALRAACFDERVLHVWLAVGDVVAHGVVEEDGLLRDLRDLAAQRAEGELAHVVAVDEDASGSHVEEARDEIDEGGFARAAGADEREHFAGMDIEIDVMQNLVLAFLGGVAEANILKADGLREPLERGRVRALLYIVFRVKEVEDGG